MNKRGGKKRKGRPAVPVTVLSGFLGSGKTTVMNHLLSTKEGLKYAVIVNDMSEVNIDAKLIKRTEGEKLIELSNGCICCTLREDLVVQLCEIARSGHDLDAILIESSGISEPIHVAETFSHAPKLPSSPDFAALVKLDTMCTVIDCGAFMSTFKRKSDSASDSLCSERSINDLLLDQVQFADVILLNKTDLIKLPHTLDDITAVIRDLNPFAMLHNCQQGDVPSECLVQTGLFSFKRAEEHADWFKEEWGDSIPETEEYGISSFVFRSKTPFHPQRLHDLLRGEGGGTAASELVSRHVEALTCVVRAKGFVWLATRHEHYMHLHVAGGSVTSSHGGKWWAACPPESWPQDPDFKREVLSHWSEPYGDRGQTLVVIGLHMDKQSVTKALEWSLLTEQELALGPEAWGQSLADPFKGAPKIEEEKGDVHGEGDGCGAEHDHTEGHVHHHSESKSNCPDTVRGLNDNP